MSRTARMGRSGLWAAGALAGLAFMGAALCVHAAPPLGMERVSLSGAERQADEPSYGPVDLTPDGLVVAFTSDSTTWTGNLLNLFPDVFIRDRVRGITELISVGTSLQTGRPRANGGSQNASISDDGRFVAFSSDSTTFAGATAAADTNNARDVFVRDRRGRTTRVSVTLAGGQTNGTSDNPSISGDGLTVAYATLATNIGPDTNNAADVYQIVVDPVFGNFTARVSEDAAAVQADGASNRPSCSQTGQFVAFESVATNLHPDDTDANSDVFIKDMLTGEVLIASLADDGSGSDGDSGLPSISADGRYVTFVSTATNLVAGDTNGVADVFVRDLQTGEIERVSVSSTDDEGDADSGTLAALPLLARPSISDDGNIVAFISDAASLDPGDSNGVTDVFVRRRSEATTDRVSVTPGGAEGDLASISATICGDGSAVGITSDASNLVAEDTNGALDVFVASIGVSSSVNLPPIPDAGTDQQVLEGDLVTLDGTGSSDPESSALRFSWRQTAGPFAVTLNSPLTATPTFTAPLVPDFTQLEFEVAVSDGVNPATRATVQVDISAAPPGILIGQVADVFGNPIPGAVATVVRTDGTEATPAVSDDFGTFTIVDVRAGTNAITVAAAGFEPSLRTVAMPRNGLLIEEFTLFAEVASLEGQVRLANGRPLAGAVVSLLDASGNELAAAAADGNGEYRVGGLDSALLRRASSIRVTSPGIITWVASAVGLRTAEVNIRNFHYGTLRVTVDTNPTSLRRRLDGTRVDILVGDVVVASNEAGRRLRTLEFPNMPAVSVRVRAVNPQLSAGQTVATVASGARATRVTVWLRNPANF